MRERERSECVRRSPARTSVVLCCTVLYSTYCTLRGGCADARVVPAARLRASGGGCVV